jgi:hypothetical protein
MALSWEPLLLKLECCIWHWSMRDLMGCIQALTQLCFVSGWIYFLTHTSCHFSRYIYLYRLHLIIIRQLIFRIADFRPPEWKPVTKAFQILCDCIEYYIYGLSAVFSSNERVDLWIRDGTVRLPSDRNILFPFQLNGRSRNEIQNLF